MPSFFGIMILTPPFPLKQMRVDVACQVSAPGDRELSEIIDFLKVVEMPLKLGYALAFQPDSAILKW
jgi:hypothetical protein